MNNLSIGNLIFYFLLDDISKKLYDIIALNIYLSKSISENIITININ
jgi:hypothetical protein